MANLAMIYAVLVKEGGQDTYAALRAASNTNPQAELTVVAIQGKDKAAKSAPFPEQVPCVADLVIQGTGASAGKSVTCQIWQYFMGNQPPALLLKEILTIPVGHSAARKQYGFSTQLDPVS